MAAHHAKVSKAGRTPTEKNGEAFSTKHLDPRSLLLDPYNPRLPPDDRGKNQSQLLAVMLERFAIDEIAESICSSGFLLLDPLIGYEDGDDTYILEGNRRLATIQLLLQPELTPPRYAKTWDEFRERLSKKSADEMREVPVRVYRDRRNVDVLAYVGFRHVNGVLPWDAEEKAAFIAQLLEDKHIRWTYDDVARKLGSKRAYVEKLYVAHRLIEQAQDLEIPGTPSMRGNFGVLTRALQSPGVVKFLGIEFPNDPQKSRRPCTKPERDLQDFVRWTFGIESSKGVEGEKAVLEDSRDLTKWGQTLASEESVRYLRTAKDPRFDRAYAKSGGMREGLVDALMAASDLLAEAVPLVRQHKREPDVQRGVERCADYLAQILSHFPQIAKQQGLEVRDTPAS